MRGLPYRASEREIADWLSEAADPDEVIIIMDRWVKVIMVIKVIMINIRVFTDPVYLVELVGLADRQTPYSEMKETPGMFTLFTASSKDISARIISFVKTI